MEEFMPWGGGVNWFPQKCNANNAKMQKNAKIATSKEIP